MKRFTALIFAGTLACAQDGLDPSPGLHLGLRIDGAQFIRGPLAPADPLGPVVSIIQRQQLSVARGEADVTVQGRLGAGAGTVQMQLEGDPDHWSVPGGVFDFAFPDELLFRAELSFAAMLSTATTATVLFQAVDGEGRAGAIRRASFALLEEPPPSLYGVSLGWDAPVDLDLHVLTPSGIDIGAKNINSFVAPPPGTSTVSDAWRDGAILDFDSNQECVYDGRQVERVLWIETPPEPGLHRVFAQLYSACGHARVGFRGLVHRGPEIVAEATSQLSAFDARLHPLPEQAPGLLLLEFEVDR